MPWPYRCCILCLREETLTEEHIIPGQIGGKLSVRFLCKECNDRVGHEIESPVKNDPAIRLAVENLEPLIPNLARQILEGQAYIGRGEGGVVRGKMKGGAFRVDAFQKEDGSVVQPAPKGREHIWKVLRKSNVAGERVDAILKQFDQGPENCLLELTPRLAAIKWRVDKVEPALDGSLLSERALLKIAYEFAACHLAEKAYDTSEQLAAIRRAVFEPSSDRQVFSIQYLTTRKYAPVHGLALAGMTPHVVVTICLFGWLLFRVHLHQIAIGSPHFKYTCYLETGEEGCEVLEDKRASDHETTG